MAELSKPIITQAMQIACAEARKWLGATSPNPPVGAVALSADGTILSVTAHQRAGKLHAEAALIEQARAQNSLSKIHTLCVTLEPCNHQGRTPPCTDAIIQSGIKHVAVGTHDPNPNVRGGGVDRLRAAGVEVMTGVNEEECQQLIHAFAYSVQTGKPWITIKRAFGKQGSMTPPTGHKTFTSPQSLRLAHQLRKKSDAIITGSGTILADNPLFTVRHILDYPDKRRYLSILDRRARVPENYLKTAHDNGFDAMTYRTLEEAINDLTAKGTQDILVEAGPLLSQALFDAGLWTMSVAIHQNDPDKIEVEFNSNSPISFDTTHFQWKYFLPETIDEKVI